MSNLGYSIMKFGTIAVLLSLLLSGFSTNITGQYCSHHTQLQTTHRTSMKSDHDSSLSAHGYMSKKATHCSQMTNQRDSAMAHCAVSSDQTPDTCPCLHNHDPIAVRMENSVLPSLSRDWLVTTTLHKYLVQQQNSDDLALPHRIDVAPPDLVPGNRLHLRLELFLN